MQVMGCTVNKEFSDNILFSFFWRRVLNVEGCGCVLFGTRGIQGSERFEKKYPGNRMA
jgi:hypothetical protein